METLITSPAAAPTPNAIVVDQIRALLAGMDAGAPDYLDSLLAVSDRVAERFEPAARAQIAALDVRNARRNQRQRQRYATKRTTNRAKG